MRKNITRHFTECTYDFCAAFAKIAREHGFHHVASGSENRFVGRYATIVQFECHISEET